MTTFLLECFIDWHFIRFFITMYAFDKSNDGALLTKQTLSSDIHISISAIILRTAFTIIYSIF